MKNRIKVLLFALSAAMILSISSCTKDELGVVRDIPPQLYLTQVKNGNILIKPENSTIDKTDKMLVLAIGVSRSGISDPQPFSVELQTSTGQLPDGVEPLSSVQLSANTIQVAQDQISGFVYLKVPKATLDANPNKVLGLTISILNPSKYTINDKLAKATVLLTVNDFAAKLEEVTSLYLKNTGGGNGTFQRSDNLGTRFGVLKDWMTSESAKNQEGGKAGGFDSYGGNGYLSLEQWGSPAILNGKVFQTARLPQGKYTFQLDFEGKQVKDQAYILAATGQMLPDVDASANALARGSFDEGKVSFTLNEQQEVSLGIVVNFVQNEQYFRARSVKLFKSTSIFD